LYYVHCTTVCDCVLDVRAKTKSQLPISGCTLSSRGLATELNFPLSVEPADRLSTELHIGYSNNRTSHAVQVYPNYNRIRVWRMYTISISIYFTVVILYLTWLYLVSKSTHRRHREEIACLSFTCEWYRCTREVGYNIIDTGCPHFLRTAKPSTGLENGSHSMSRSGRRRPNN